LTGLGISLEEKIFAGFSFSSSAVATGIEESSI
jgi:hypothetical protein